MERNRETVKYTKIRNILEKYGYYYDCTPDMYWEFWKHKNPVDIMHNLEIKPLNNHLIILHSDQEGGTLDIEPVQVFYESAEQFEAIIRGITDIEMINWTPETEEE